MIRSGKWRSARLTSARTDLAADPAFAWAVWLLRGDHRALALDQALEIENEIVRCGVAVLAVLGEHCLDDHAQAAGKPGVEVVWGHELDPWVNMLAHHFRGVVAAVGNPGCRCRPGYRCQSVPGPARG